MNIMEFLMAYSIIQVNMPTLALIAISKLSLEIKQESLILRCPMVQ
jgi:hypothetical protein